MDALSRAPLYTTIGELCGIILCSLLFVDLLGEPAECGSGLISFAFTCLHPGSGPSPEREVRSLPLPGRGWSWRLRQERGAGVCADRGIEDLERGSVRASRFGERRIEKRVELGASMPP